jgi:hypothetical protein
MVLAWVRGKFSRSMREIFFGSISIYMIFTMSTTLDVLYLFGKSSPSK